MIKNYFKTTWRNLRRNPLYPTLNIAGLTLGISCFLLIGLYLFDELTFDHQHNKAGRIYRVVENKNANGEATTIAAALNRFKVEGLKGKSCIFYLEP